ncbi:peptidoglycan endopeptidase [Sesbania bispinosa]|nr:peptidoglycan endopeptidase [Sesbania bispinosa]
MRKSAKIIRSSPGSSFLKELSTVIAEVQGIGKSGGTEANGGISSGFMYSTNFDSFDIGVYGGWYGCSYL